MSKTYQSIVEAVNAYSSIYTPSVCKARTELGDFFAELFTTDAIEGYAVHKFDNHIYIRFNMVGDSVYHMIDACFEPGRYGAELMTGDDVFGGDTLNDDYDRAMRGI